VWANPQSKYVAEFLGLGTVFAGEVVTKNKIETKHGVFVVRCNHKYSKGEKVHLLARPLPVKDEANVISGVVVDVIFQQDHYKVTFGNGLYIYMNEAPQIGKKISVPVKVECLAL
jgi:ABC-type Fe3+/spermidine/putrescine transport system ATPase subunit